MEEKDSMIDQVFEEHVDVSYILDCGAFDECFQAAKLRLADPTLSSYGRMKYLLLITCIRKYWHEVAQYPLEAERIWHDENRAAGVSAKGWLKEIREDLDELQRTQAEELEQYVLAGSDGDTDESEPKYYIQSREPPTGAVGLGPEEIAAINARECAKKTARL